MPTYSYQCKNCSHQFDAFQGINDEPLKECPKCKQANVKRGIGGGSAVFNFKGSGFYITDYKDQQDGCCPCGKEKKDCKSDDA